MIKMCKNSDRNLVWYFQFFVDYFLLFNIKNLLNYEKNCRVNISIAKLFLKFKLVNIKLVFEDLLHDKFKRY